LVRRKSRVIMLYHKLSPVCKGIPLFGFPVYFFSKLRKVALSAREDLHHYHTRH